MYAQPDFDDGSVLSLAGARAIFERMGRHPDFHLYVADLDRRVVGTYALLIMPNLGHLGRPSGIVEDVVVAPDVQGRGIGRAMVDFAREQCRQAGCYKLVLSSNERRESAHAFYESLGFERHGFSFRIDLGADGEP